MYVTTVLYGKVNEICFFQLYRRVRDLFEPWPHLVSLFTEFLSPQDCLEANVVSVDILKFGICSLLSVQLEDKHDIENAKSFIARLQV